MKRKTRQILLTTALSLFFIAGCSQKQEISVPVVNEPIDLEKTSHSWYYFSNNNFNKIDKPQHAPASNPKPWTETIRISSANTTFSPSNESTKGFAIVNRLGVLCFEGNDIYLASDGNIFNDRTAGNLVFFDNTPIYSVYKSSFFNETIREPEYTKDNSSHLFLIQFDDKVKISYPIINSNSLIDEPNSEIIDFVWDYNDWFCAVKTISDTKNKFSYLSWQPQMPLLSMSPGKAANNISVRESSIEEFKKVKQQKDYSSAPKRIKNLIAGFSDSYPFTLEIKTAGGNTPEYYVREIEGCTEKAFQGKAILSQSWSCVLFEDGTLFLEGALPGKHILRNGKPIAIRLTKLPAGFIYTEFTLSNNTLYAAWEESAFYTTSRSGFIQVDLNETLYKKML